MTSKKTHTITPGGSGRTRHQRNNRLATGILIILIGLILFLRRLDLFSFSFQVWPLILIAVGLYLGWKHNFRSLASWCLILLGIVFLVPRFTLFGVLSVYLVTPTLLILVGLFIIFRSGNSGTMNTGPHDLSAKTR